MLKKKMKQIVEDMKKSCTFAASLEQSIIRLLNMLTHWFMGEDKLMHSKLEWEGEWINIDLD